MMPVLFRDAPRLTNFRLVRPAYVASQRETFEWLARAHAESARARATDPASFDGAAYYDCARELLERVGCGPDKIAMRGYEVADCAHMHWSEMRIYDLARHPEGAGTRARAELFSRASESAVDRLYADEETPPQEIVHVTCTGYASPSAAQKLVAKRGWGRTTRVTHAYHMGCYASLPAVRIANGSLAQAASSDVPPRVDIVHNEICSLHLQPSQHTSDQLVVESLFSDGHIRYSVVEHETSTASLAVIGTREEILPDTAQAMSWTVGDFGMSMTLARDVPERIARAVRSFVMALHREVDLDPEEHRAHTLFAIHPGGPRIIDAVERTLELSEAQVAASRDVLLRYGNMSSATLPHVWMEMARADEVLAGTLIVSLAFGPGLTLSGALMVKS